MHLSLLCVFESLTVSRLRKKGYKYLSVLGERDKLRIVINIGHIWGGGVDRF